MSTNSINELSREGTSGAGIEDAAFPAAGDYQRWFDQHQLRQEPIGLPEIAEVDVVRYFTNLSRQAHGVDNGPYPLGSCTMKYSPKLHDQLATLDGFAHVHPRQPPDSMQGVWDLCLDLQNCIAELTGMDAVSLQPAAGAHGEFTGLLVIRKYFDQRGEPRDVILIADTAHGTNPASAMLCGYKSFQLPSNSEGTIDVAKLESAMDEETAAIMLTNPNTLGMFEKDILKITEIVHKKGGLVYCDGANLNAIMGIAKMGDMGIDVMHINLHKTFSTPHGGGGPGAGPRHRGTRPSLDHRGGAARGHVRAALS